MQDAQYVQCHHFFNMKEHHLRSPTCVAEVMDGKAILLQKSPALGDSSNLILIHHVLWKITQFFRVNQNISGQKTSRTSIFSSFFIAPDIAGKLWHGPIPLRSPSIWSPTRTRESSAPLPGDSFRKSGSMISSWHPTAYSIVFFVVYNLVDPIIT